MPTLQGRAQSSMGAVWDGKPGDYYVIKHEGVIRGLWFMLPTGGLGRIASTEVGEDPEHEWTITEDGGGLVTVDPSILQHAMPGADKNPALAEWHGHLRNGVWEW